MKFVALSYDENFLDIYTYLLDEYMFSEDLSGDYINNQEDFYDE